MTQPSLFDKNKRDQTEAWLKLNPAAWELFLRFALEKMRRGQRFGVHALMERVRWEEPINTEGDEYKINNNFSPYIARKLIEMYPKLEEYIELRKTKW